MKKKICFVLPEYARATHFQYVAEFVEGLANHADVFLVIEKGDLPKESKVTHRVRQFFRFPPLRFVEIALILLYARLRGYRTQYVHYSFSAAFWSSLITRAFGGTTYYWNAGLPWLYKRPFVREWFEHVVFHLIGKLVTGADALVAGYESFYHIPAEKIIVIPNWIDAGGVQSGNSRYIPSELKKNLHISDTASVALFVHRLSPRKGADKLPEILKGLDPRTVLVVIGDGPLRGVLENQFASKEFSDRVRMLGAVPQSEVAAFFGIADVFLLPSEEEGCPHVLLEALASGVPYVATDVGGVREMPPPKMREYIVSYGDGDAFINAVNHIVRLPEEKRGELSDEEHEWVKQFGKEHIIERFIKSVV